MSNNYNKLFQGNVAQNKEQKLATNKIVPYKNQPFKLYSQEKIKSLANDIDSRGLDNPIIVRPYNNGYQIICGHNRFVAMTEYLGYTEVPVVVKELDDNEAIITLTQSNIQQRESLSDVEKIRAYTLREKAMKELGQKSNERKQALADESKVSSRTIARYIACGKLIEDLIELIGEKKLSVPVGEKLTTLSEDNQRVLAEYLWNHTVKITPNLAQVIKNEETLTAEILANIFDPKTTSDETTTSSSKTKKALSTEKAEALAKKFIESEQGESFCDDNDIDNSTIIELFQLLNQAKMLK